MPGCRLSLCVCVCVTTKLPFKLKIYRSETLQRDGKTASLQGRQVLIGRDDISQERLTIQLQCRTLLYDQTKGIIRYKILKEKKKCGNLGRKLECEGMISCTDLICHLIHTFCHLFCTAPNVIRLPFHPCAYNDMPANYSHPLLINAGYRVAAISLYYILVVGAHSNI